MGITHAGLHLPDRSLDGKTAREAGIASGFERLRVPWFDEDALTMALEAGLLLEDGLDGVDEIVLATDEPVDEPGLVRLVLDVDAPVQTVTGDTSGLQALTRETGDRLVLAAGSSVGGAGVALRVTPGEGVRIEATASAAGPRSASLGEVLDSLAGEHEQRLPAGTGDDPHATARIGDAGPAGPLVELAHAIDEGQPVATGSQDGGQAVAVATGQGRIELATWPGARTEIEPADYERLTTRKAPPWSEASQGAYVSREEYDLDPQERYGARALGPGTVETVTTIQAGPPGEFLRQHEQAGAYDVAIVQTDGAKRSIRQSALPPGQLSIGDRVRPVLRRVFEMEGQTRYGLKSRRIGWSMR